MEYTGPRRREMDSIELMINTIEKLFSEKINTINTRLDKMELDTKKDIESIRSSVENLFHTYDLRARTDLSELDLKVNKIENRLRALEEAPLKKAADLQKGFFKSGQDLATKAIWGVLFAFLGFLIMQYLGVFK